ncbi:MAG: hypothetical protein ACI9D0_000146 [Bacteroidia bacterium]|jgi:hypothetical protein
MKISLVASALAVLASSAFAQAPQRGLTLFNPNFDQNTYLLDNNGQIVHTWNLTQNPGNTVYLEEDGTLLRSHQIPGGIGIGGKGGGVQRVRFDGSFSWEFPVANSLIQQHHDVLPMPNGNVMMIVWSKQTAADAIAAGRNPSLISSPTFFPEILIEYQQSGPTTGTEVWRWESMDHLVQDFDPTKPNFGVVADHPERIDINFPPNVITNGDWLHGNSVSYDEQLDQLLFSVPFLNELWIIDHSTTSAEAAGSTGGNSGKGGDLLYRWGNPAAYDAGTSADQKLFNQHGGMFIEPGRPGAGNILVFNNQVPGPVQHSEVWELTRQADAGGNYPLAPGAAFGPAAPTWSYAAPVVSDFNSGFLSSAQRMPNGNTMVCSGVQGWLFEVDPAGTKVWEYFNTLPAVGNKWIFKTRRYEHYLWSDTPSLSAAAGGTVQFDLACGSDFGGDFYLVLGSVSGTSPGTPINGELVPLVADAYTNLTFSRANTGPFSQTFGALDALGRASASLTVPAGIASVLVGIEVNHAFVVFNTTSLTVTLASNAQSLSIEP